MAAKRGHARPAGVEEQITRKRIASELGRSRVRPEQFRFWSASGRENRKPMMNERGKSDPAVVATKLANKAERSAAELVEPRAGTKGNANPQHSGRAQSRETVSQLLARIRQTARERKKERFTSSSLGPNSDLPSLTRGRSRMRESRTYGSVRGAGSNLRPYRDRLGSCSKSAAIRGTADAMPTWLQRQPMTHRRRGASPAGACPDLFSCGVRGVGGHICQTSSRSFTK